ncbi:LPS-assembly protein LptD [Roseovarius salinarum]|uniref:LPS-assembly protein LptD n=1 Tax=Roseovarius salinarum TaxID=1981892 RepID=UPI000C320CAA|nr:LPS assembly protein LptD [Roseovarius salinarum]
MRPARRIFRHGAWLAALAVLLGAALLSTSAAAQDGPAVLVADSIRTEGGRLIAAGNVEVMHGGRRMTAERVVYDRAADSLRIEGPITLHEGEETVVLADAAALDADLRNGILRGARIVLGRQLQLAAARMERRGGRYVQLDKTAVTSCRICEDGDAPLWQIRADRVIHDREARQLYFEGARFMVRDTPVFYLPRLRLPDPTVKRATGFLIPSLYTSSLLGTGVKVPYFIRMGDHRDLTLTPFVTGKTRTMEFRYRQAFRNGDLSWRGAVSDDDIGSDSRRGYSFLQGDFALDRGYQLSFDIEATSDDVYMLEYGYSEKDRLDSRIAVDRAERDEYVLGALTHYESLRAGESNATLPTRAVDATYERRMFPAATGGELRLTLGAHAHERTSSIATDGPDVDLFADGRDMTRLSAGFDWRRTWTGPAGLRATTQAGLAADGFFLSDAGATSLSRASEVTPETALTLRWPLSKTGPDGARHLLEPLAQVAWVGGANPDIPNDESTRPEFDEGNLLSMSRFAAPDRRERGAAAALGTRWTRFGTDGGQTTLALGKVVRDERQLDANGTPDFTRTSGLQGRHSDTLAAVHVERPNGLSLTTRGLFENSLDAATKAETRAAWTNARADFGATYIWLRADPAENRPRTISEWSLDGSYRLSRHWTGSAHWRYDVARDEAVTAGLGLTYTNECVDITLSASRRFTSSGVLEPSTGVSLTVGLRGFSARKKDGDYVRTCRN